MIAKENKSVVNIYYKNKPIINVYMKTRLIWSNVLTSISSCFYNGYWDDNSPWTDDTSWE